MIATACVYSPLNNLPPLVYIRHQLSRPIQLVLDGCPAPRSHPQLRIPASHPPYHLALPPRAGQDRFPPHYVSLLSAPPAQRSVLARCGNNRNVPLSRSFSVLAFMRCSRISLTRLLS